MSGCRGVRSVAAAGRPVASLTSGALVGAEFDRSGYPDRMRRLLALTVLCALGVTAPAQAHKLTVHRAKVEIRRQAIYVLGAHANYVTVGHCSRTSGRRVLCTMRRKMEGPSCFGFERWSALLSRDGTFTQALALLNADYRASGACATVLVTPVDGDVSTSSP